MTALFKDLSFLSILLIQLYLIQLAASATDDEGYSGFGVIFEDWNQYDSSLEADSEDSDSTDPDITDPDITDLNNPGPDYTDQDGAHPGADRAGTNAGVIVKPGEENGWVEKVDEEAEFLNNDDYYEMSKDKTGKPFDEDSEETTECRRQRKAGLPSNSLYLARCTVEGEFEEIQCAGRHCFCVDAAGDRRPGLDFQLPQKPHCPGIREAVGVIAITTERIVVEDKSESEADDSRIISHNKIYNRDYTIWVIVVALICSMLVILVVVMTLCLRMRKKDEGQYKLHENKSLYCESYEAAKARQCDV